MTQFEIDHAVSAALGEDIQNVRAMGFSLLDLSLEYVDPECDRQAPQVIDWDGPVDGATVQSFHDVTA